MSIKNIIIQRVLIHSIKLKKTFLTTCVPIYYNVLSQNMSYRRLHSNIVN